MAPTLRHAAAALLAAFAVAHSARAADTAPMPPPEARLPHTRPARSWTSPLLAAEARKSGLIYVSDAGYEVIDIYTKSIPNQLMGQIGTGICLPTGLATDAANTLYVASYYAQCAGAGPSITVFPAGATTPSQTIIAGMFDPDQLTVSPIDGTLYASDGGHNILEYARGKTTLRKIVYPPGGLPDGVALDPHDILYTSYFDPASSTGRVGRYDATTKRFIDLGIVLQLAGAITFDAAGNLLVEDQRAGTVQIFPPGATTPSKTFHGFSDPFTMTLDRTANVLYVADLGRRRIDEVSYPSGKLLGSITGFDFNTFGVAVTQAKAH